MATPPESSPRGQFSLSGGSSGRRGKRTFTKAGLIGAIVLVGYSIAQPKLNDRFGWNLPALSTANERAEQPPAAANPSIGKATGVGERTAAAPASDSGSANEKFTTSDKSQSSPQTGDALPAEKSNPAGPASKPPGPLADRMPTNNNRSNPTPSGGAAATEGGGQGTRSNASVADDPAALDDPSLKYGFLRDIGGDRYISPAGLQYVPGSAEGHRLEHLKRHTEDQPGRPGSHGVFEGGMEAVVRVLDQAYTKAKEDKPGVTKSQDQNRTIYTVDMGKRIGYVGGRDGNRRRKPMARRVRMVLEGTRVITAYPL